MKIRTIDEVIKEANDKWNIQMSCRPDIYKEDGRVSFCYGWLQQEYKFMFNQLDIKKEWGCYPAISDRSAKEFYEWLMNGRLFFVDEVRGWLKLLDKEEISMSKFVELFNERVFNWLQIKVKTLETRQTKIVLQNPKYYNCGVPLESRIQGIDDAIRTLLNSDQEVQVSDTTKMPS
jgi:hypothetical protein